MDKSEIRARLIVLKAAITALEEAVEVREFHCYACKQDKPIALRSQRHSAMCRQCCDAETARARAETEARHQAWIQRGTQRQ